MTDYIEHFGVKGMKWGVRKKQEYSTDFAKTSDVGIKTNADGSTTFPKNFKFNRIGKQQLDINQSGALYVSHGKVDAARYMQSLGPTLLGKLLGTASEAVQHISVKEPLKMPSDKQAAEESIRALLSNSKLRKEFNESIYSMSASDKPEGVSSSDLERMLKDPSSKESMKVAYSLSALLGDGQYAPEAKMVYSHFRDKGWDALPDFNDTLTGRSATAMVVINPNKLAFESSTLITKDIMASGRQVVKEAGTLPLSEYLK